MNGKVLSNVEYYVKSEFGARCNLSVQTVQ
jgi:hypothetical protein